MRDFIFVTGPSGVGKSTLMRRLFDHYGGAYAEMHTVPEFTVPEGVDPGLFEEEVCWQCCKVQLDKFHELGLHPVISGDFDDLRTRDLPLAFKGSDFIILRLICHDYEENERRMLNRGKGLIDLDLLRGMHEKINSRPLMPNEVMLDTAGKSPDEVFSEAVSIIDHYITQKDYHYDRQPKELFYSWVKSNGLR